MKFSKIYEVGGVGWGGGGSGKPICQHKTDVGSNTPHALLAILQDWGINMSFLMSIPHRKKPL